MKRCRVWQLKPESSERMLFRGLAEVTKEFGAPRMDNYETVYDGAVKTNELEALYTEFNLNHPSGYAGHSLSVSDVLELYDESGSTYHYCDTFGFEEITFEPQPQAPAMQL